MLSEQPQKLHDKMLSNAISELLLFKNFLGGGMPPDPPSNSMLRMLTVLCTLSVASISQYYHLISCTNLYITHDLEPPIFLELPPPLFKAMMVT